MAQILVRDLDDGLVDRLKGQARRNHRSLQGEVRAIIEDGVRLTPAETATRAEAWRKRLAGRTFGDSTVLVRADRRR